MSSLVLRVNISSVELIRRSLGAKLKGMARFRMQGGMKSVTDIDASVCFVTVIVLRAPTYPTDLLLRQFAPQAKEDPLLTTCNSI